MLNNSEGITQDSNAEIFDVFLCHNSEDKPAIREIFQKLAEKNIKPWLDEEQIRPGTSWQTALGQQLGRIKSVAIFVGESGLGPWHNPEIQALLSQFVNRACPIIFVILPLAKTTPDLPWTMKNLHWVDFRVTDLDPLKQLTWGITGENHCERSHVSSSHNPSMPREGDVKELVPCKDKVMIELRLAGRTIDAFSDEERDKFLAELSNFLGLDGVRLTRTTADSIRLHLELKPEDADKIYAATQNGQLAALGISEARLYPAIAVPPDAEQRSQMLILRDRVKETWVDGVLRNSLYNDALMSLGRRAIEEAVESPWKHVVELSSQRSQLILQDRNITTIFDATGLLLILGDPGSGKTTTLLDLARTLLDRSQSDIRERVPVVLNLTSWKKNLPLGEWIVGELSEKYRVPRKIARFWLHHDYLLPLLDGLDEMETLMQPDCVAAINAFIEELKPSGLVVCCRLNEYRWVPERLKLNGAFCLKSLSSEEVNKYLAEGGSKLAALREAVNTDPVLQDLAQTPLMLCIISLAYQEAGGNELSTPNGDSAEERRKQIFRLYIEQMFQRKGTASLAFSKEKTIGWLSWLAGTMREHSQSVFLVEELQPSWLGTRAKRVAYGIVAALSLGLIGGLTIGLIFGLTYTVIFWLIWLPTQIFALIGMLITVLGFVLVVFVMPYGLSFWLIFGGLIGGLIGRLNHRLIFGLSFGGLIGGLGFGLISVSYTLSQALSQALSEVLSFGMSFGLTILVGVGLGCWSESSLKNGIKSGSIAGLIVALFVAPFVGLLTHDPIIGTSIGLIGGLIFGLIDGLIGGLGTGSLNHITSVETKSWKWKQFWKRAIPGSVFGLIFGLIVGLIGEIIGSIFFDFGYFALIFGIFGLIFGLIGGLIGGLFGGFTYGVKVGKASPNQGIKLSREYSLAAFLVTWLSSALIFALILGLISASIVGLTEATGTGVITGVIIVIELIVVGLIFWLSTGLIVGLIFGLIAGLNRGGSAVIKHYALRLTLWQAGDTPLMFVEFLDHCARLNLLKKVGGGYIFIHRLLLEYFAEMIPQSKRPERLSDEFAELGRAFKLWQKKVLRAFAVGLVLLALVGGSVWWFSYTWHWEKKGIKDTRPMPDEDKYSE
jgi:eukaryotic-like serine/threonine-protein kinase